MIQFSVNQLGSELFPETSETPGRLWQDKTDKKGKKIKPSEIVEMQENSSIWDVVNEGKTMWKRWASVVHLWDFFWECWTTSFLGTFCGSSVVLLVNVGGIKVGSQVLRWLTWLATLVISQETRKGVVHCFCGPKLQVFAESSCYPETLLRFFSRPSGRSSGTSPKPVVHHISHRCEFWHSSWDAKLGWVGDYIPWISPTFLVHHINLTRLMPVPSDDA